LLKWMKGRRPAGQNRVEPAAAKAKRSAMSGKSTPLHKYLDERYADAVVLTFAEIEDLVGFALPELARLSNDWWTTPDPDASRPRFADAWILANRTARPNLPARTVAFNRAF